MDSLFAKRNFQNESRIKYALDSLVVFLFSLILFIYLLFLLGVISKDKIVVKAIATTGPDYEVVFGQLKLKFQMPDSVGNTNVNGVMLIYKSLQAMNNYINRNSSWPYDDYYVLREKIVGAKRSDGTAFPLIEITSFDHLNKLFLWTFIFIDIGLLLLSSYYTLNTTGKINTTALNNRSGCTTTLKKYLRQFKEMVFPFCECPPATLSNLKTQEVTDCYVVQAIENFL